MTSSTRLLIRTLAVFALFLTLTHGQWLTTSTDTVTRSPARKWASMQAIVCDSAATLHATWTEAATVALRNVMYARRPADSVWTRPEIVAESAGNHVAIAVEPGTGTAHLVWAAPTGSTADICHATNRSGNWVVTRLTQDSLAEWQPSIALEDNRVHLAWIVQTPDRAYHIAYATDRSGAWQTQVLWGSQLGGFGSGASPWIAVEPSGLAHITYRGGDYPAYRVHHAQSRIPGDTVWFYEVLGPTENDVDYVSAVAAHDSGELFVVVSGNDGWGFPWTTCYLHRPANSAQWDQYQLMTASASALLRGFALDHNYVHCTWERINGNINTEEIYHCSNFNGYWFNSGIRTDGISSTGALTIGPDHRGHALILVGASPDSSELYCVNSAPLTGILDAHRSLSHDRCRATLTRTLPGPDAFLPDGRQVRAVPGRTLPAGLYFVRAETETTPFLLVK